MFILSSISRGLELWSDHTSILQENPELKVLKNIKFLGEISNNWQNDLFGTNVYNCWMVLIIIVDNVTMN